MAKLAIKLKKSNNIRLLVGDAVYKVSSISVPTDVLSTIRYTDELQRTIHGVGKLRFQENGRLWVDIPRKNRFSFAHQAIILIACGGLILWLFQNGSTLLLINKVMSKFTDELTLIKDEI